MFNFNNFLVKIRPTILFLFFIVVFVFSTLILVQKYYDLKNIAINETQNNFAQYSKNISERIASFDKTNSNILIPLSDIQDITKMPELNSKYKHINTFVDILKNNKNLYAIHFGDKKGNLYVLINLSIEEKINLKNSYKTAIWQENRIYYNGKRNILHKYFLDKNLKIVEEVKAQTSYDLKTRSWYTLSQIKDSVIKTPPYSFAHLLLQGITYAKRVKNLDASLGLSYTLRSITQKLKNNSLKSNVNAFIFNDDKELTANLNAKDKKIFLEKKVKLTKEEKNYLKNLGTIVVSNDHSWMPFDFTISGIPKGYSVDLFKLMAKKADIKIRFMNGYTWMELLNLFENDKIDIVNSIISRSYKTEDTYISDKPYLKVKPMLILRKNSKYTTLKELEKNKRSIINVEGYAYTENYIRKNYPNLQILYAKNPVGAFKMLEEGTSTAYIEIDKTFENITKSHHINDLKMVELPLGEIDLTLFSGLKFMSKDKKLVEIFDRICANITKEEKDFLHQKWFSNKHIDFFINNSNTIPSKKILNIARKNSDKITQIIINNNKYFLFTSKLKNVSHDHYFAILTKESNILAPYMKKILDSSIMSIIIFLITLPAIWYLTSMIVKPILALEKENEKMKNREYNKVNIIQTRIKELNDLSLSFFDLASIIKNHEKEHENLLNSFIHLMAESIDEKSIYTGSHCHRVPILTLMLTEKAIESKNEPFKDFDLKTKDEKRELTIASWLHDCGKVTTPEYVVDKAVKLETIYNRIHEIRTRFEVIYRDLQIQAYEKIQNNEDREKTNTWLNQEQNKLKDDFEFIAKCNVGGEFMSDEDMLRVEEIAKRPWVRFFDNSLGLSISEEKRYTNIDKVPFEENLLSDKKEHIIKREVDRTKEYEKYGFKVNIPKDLYNLGEIYNLSIKKGTLTEEERFKINEHIMVTIKMLNKLPLPERLKRIPEYAGGHHETLIGTGYPKKLSKEDMSIPSRIMAISDIFEALTASDRPYKKAKTLSESLKIMKFMVADKHIDPDIFDLFLKSGVYMKYAKRFLFKEQIDDINIEDYLS